MNRLRKFGAGLAVFLLLSLWGIAGHPVLCHAEEFILPYQADGVINVSTSVVGHTKVKVTFRKQPIKIDRIRLFRKNGGKKWKKIATLKGSAQSYKDTVKFNISYDYKAVAYQKRGKKYKKLGSHTCSARTSVTPVYWVGFADEQYSHPKTTPESVYIHAEIDTYSYPEDGYFEPSGYEIYKSTDNKSFECIKADKITNPLDIEYVDTDVQKGQTYYYKLRGFLKYNKKTYYSIFSHTEMCMAVNSRGIYSVKVLAGREEALSSVDVCLVSEEGNADLVIQNTGRSEEAGGLGCFDNGSSPYSYVLITQYSINGTDWFPVEENSIVLKPGQAIYLRIERADGLDFDLTGETAWIYDIPISCYPDYNLLWIDLIQQEVRIMAEYD